MLKLALALFASLLAASAGAVTVLTATLTNGAENPPASPTTSTGAVRPASFGTASFVINDLMNSMTFTATIFNIDVPGSQTADVNVNIAASNIHAGPGVTPATYCPVVWGFFGSPFNDNNPNDAVATPFATGVGGTFSGKWDLNEGNNGTTFALQLPNILAGRSYINFHTLQFGGGEIRGNITLVPEPETYLLLLGGLALLTRTVRRRRSA